MFASSRSLNEVFWKRIILVLNKVPPEETLSSGYWTHVCEELGCPSHLAAAGKSACHRGGHDRGHGREAELEPLDQCNPEVCPSGALASTTTFLVLYAS